MRLKIVSDGTVEGTYVCCAESGRKVAGVQIVTWSISSDDLMSEASIHLWGAPCEIEAEAGMILEDDVTSTSLPANGDNVIDFSEILKQRKDE